MNADNEETGLVLFDDTKHVNLQGKQYHIFNLDLGEGIIRDYLLLGFLVCAGWVVIMLLLPTLPFLTVGATVFLWVGPPSVVIALAITPDKGDRPRYALWWCKARYLTRRWRPLVPPLGYRPVSRWLTRVERIVRPIRHPGFPARPFKVRAEFVIIP